MQERLGICGFLRQLRRVRDQWNKIQNGNDTRHHLWAETVAALRWELEDVASYPSLNPQRRFFLPVREDWLAVVAPNKSGNYNNGINKRWPT